MGTQLLVQSKCSCTSATPARHSLLLLPLASTSVTCHSSPPCPLSKPKLPLPRPRLFLRALFHIYQHPQYLVQWRLTLLSVCSLKIPLPALALIVPDTSYTEESIRTCLDSCHIWSLLSLSQYRIPSPFMTQLFLFHILLQSYALHSLVPTYCLDLSARSSLSSPHPRLCAYSPLPF